MNWQLRGMQIVEVFDGGRSFRVWAQFERLSRGSQAPETAEFRLNIKLTGKETIDDALDQAAALARASLK